MPSYDPNALLRAAPGKYVSHDEDVNEVARPDKHSGDEEIKRKNTMADEVDAPKPTIEPTTKARAGITGHNVRYVLAFGLAGAIVAFLIIGLYFYGVEFSWPP